MLPAAPPDLECSDLGQAVFDVVEGMQKDVELAVPTGDAFPFEARPVHPPLEAAAEPEPRGGSRRPGPPTSESVARPEPGGVARRPLPAVTAGVEPTLKRIHRRDMRERQQHVF